MKNFLIRNKKNDTPQASAQSTRITNETVAEHREQILAGGRKFKYPLQYQKHKLVVNSIAIGLVAIMALSIFGWYRLYIAQRSDKLLYQVTQIIPVMVASVDGEPVRYSDYLMRYRSVLFYKINYNQLSLGSVDGQREMERKKREELDTVEQNAYATKLARKYKITVKDSEVESFIKKDVDGRSVSMNAYEKTVLASFYDLSLDEYRRVVKDELLKRKVKLAVDVAAQRTIKDLHARVSNGEDITAIAKSSSDDESTKQNGGDSGVLSIKNQDTNGLIAAAQALEPGRLSDIIEGVDGFYFLKLTSKDADTVRYAVVRVALREFDSQFAQLRKDKKIDEYIAVPLLETSTDFTQPQ